MSLALVLPLCLSPAALFAQEQAPQLAGEWRGAIELPGMELEVALTIRREEGGALAGAIDIPAQNAKGLPLAGFEREEGGWRFEIEGVPGKPTFRGELSEEGARFAGSFTQGTGRFAFALTRLDAAAALEEARARLEGLEAFVAQALEDWETPGLALAVVSGDGVVLAQGFGLRDVEGALPVTADTLFAIGSTTKAFTAALLGDLVEEGLVEWDAPARRYLPELELHDDYASAHITVRDLCTHRSGLPRHDLAWYGSSATREELLARLKHLEPSAGFRERFQYQNLMYMVAGLIAGRVAGTSWEEELEARLLAPLGMTRSVLTIDALTRVEDRALGYQEEEDALEEVPYRVIDAMGPAGSIESSASEMARWLRFLVGRGELEGLRILEEASFDELFAPVTVVPRGPLQTEHEGQSTYALGWMVQSYRGHERAHHGGGIDGFTALVTVLPSERIGVVALANRGGSSAPNLVTSWVLDRALELEPIDWNALLKPLAAAAEAQAEALKDEGTGERVEGTSPSHPLADYTGEYEHPGYGRMRIALEEGALRADFHAFDAPLEHWHYDSFRIADGPAEETLVLFRADTSGQIAALVVALEPSVAPIVFERRPPAELEEPEFLSRLVGRYSLGPQVAQVALRGDRLTVSLPGQPTYTLDPWREREFRLRGMEGFSLRFELGEEGPAQRITFVQPNGRFTGERAQDP